MKAKRVEGLWGVEVNGLPFMWSALVMADSEAEARKKVKEYLTEFGVDSFDNIVIDLYQPYVIR